MKEHFALHWSLGTHFSYLPSANTAPLTQGHPLVYLAMHLTSPKAMTAHHLPCQHSFQEKIEKKIIMQQNVAKFCNMHIQGHCVQDSTFTSSFNPFFVSSPLHMATCILPTWPCCCFCRCPTQHAMNWQAMQGNVRGNNCTGGWCQKKGVTTKNAKNMQAKNKCKGKFQVKFLICFVFQGQTPKLLNA